MNLTYEDENDDYNKKPSIRVVSREELATIMEEQEVLLNF
jgi:tRNA 2-thiouridine synthesizing protein C